MCQQGTAVFGFCHTLLHCVLVNVQKDAQSQSASPCQQNGNQSAVDFAASDSIERSASARAQSTPASSSRGIANNSWQASLSTARVAGLDHANGAGAVPQFATMSVPEHAARDASEPDLAAAETLSPESAVVSPARLQSPDQALPGLSAFQMRLHSMLPQLPTMQKLAQLSQEVSTDVQSSVQRCPWTPCYDSERGLPARCQGIQITPQFLYFSCRLCCL